MAGAGMDAAEEQCMALDDQQLQAPERIFNYQPPDLAAALAQATSSGGSGGSGGSVAGDDVASEAGESVIASSKKGSAKSKGPERWCRPHGKYHEVSVFTSTSPNMCLVGKRLYDNLFKARLAL
jgi:hypothetical protein